MKRLLFISHRVPYPPDKGERVRAFHALRALSARFGVTLAALAHRRSDYAAAAALRPWCERVIVAPAGGAMGLLRGGLALLGGRSVTEGFFHSPTMKHLLARECRRDRFDLVLGYCSSTLPLALAVPAAARVMDLVDIDSLKWRSYAAGARWPASWLYRAESGRLRAMERRAVETCQAALCVSEAEAGACSFGDRKLTVVENGVDADYFKPSPAGAASSRGVVFTGTMSYRPNVDAVVWFAGEVWPGLVREIPDLTFAIVGRDPTRAVRRLGRRAGVRVVGAVPDVRPYLDAAAVAAAPLRIARGVQNKVLEAMAMQKPVVASPQALEGLDVEDGRHLLRAETPRQWRERILQLIRDEDLRRRLGKSARAWVQRRYNWTARTAPLVALCERLASP